MKTFRFRDFPVYQATRRFRVKVLEVLSKFPTTEKFRLIDQINRSCLSVLLNIAEGSAKHSDADFARFLEMGIGSLNELVAGFDAAFDSGLVSENVRKEIEAEAEELVKQLGGFVKKLRSPQSIVKS